MIEKIQELAEKIHQTDWDKEEKMDTCEFICDELKKVGKYVNSVINETLYITVYSKVPSVDRPANYNEKRIEYDQNRRIVHNSCIDAIQKINRIMKTFNVEKLVDIPETSIDSMSENERNLVGVKVSDFAAEFINEIYQLGIEFDKVNLIDNVVEKRLNIVENRMTENPDRTEYEDSEYRAELKPSVLSAAVKNTFRDGDER